MRELCIPDGVEVDPQATEMLRLWAANNKLNVSINLGCYHDQGHDEASAWGVILTDLARHVAHGLAQRYDKNEVDEAKKIIEGILAELDSPTTDIKGT